MKTYSRRNPKSRNTDYDAVFSGVHEQSADTESSNTVSENGPLKQDSKKRKNKMAKSEKPKLFKRSKKQTPVSKETEISKQTTSKSEDMIIPLNNSDSLFADPIDVGKKTRSRCQKKTTQVSQTLRRQKRSDVTLHDEVPPKTQVGCVDKVSQWLADSQYADPPSEKEIFREIHDPPMERRHDMVPDLQFDGLQTKPALSHDQANRVDFLYKFGQKKTIEPTVKQGVTRSSQSIRTVSTTETLSQDTDSTDVGTTEMLVTETATPITGMMTETQGDLSTAYTDTQTPMMEDSDVTKYIGYLSRAPRKYMSSTFRKSISDDVDTFPSELSTVTESLITQKRDEKTPQRRTDDFKVPSSPTKSAPKTTQKKGSLHPKNSTQLFTSGCVEIVDVIPQMSTIIMDRSSKKSIAAQKVVSSITEDIDTAVVKKTKPVMQTSTPNKGDSNEPHFQFDTDISSVTVESENESELVFNQSSRLVNSDEIMQLSSSQIEQIDVNVTVPTAEYIDNQNKTVQYDDENTVLIQNNKQSDKKRSVQTDQHKARQRKLSAKKQVLYCAEQSTKNVRHPKSLKVLRQKSMIDLRRAKGQSMGDNSGNIRQTLKFSSSSSTPQGRRRSSRSSSSTKQRKMFFYHTDMGQSQEQLENDPNDNSVFEPELRKLPDGRYVPVCPLMYGGPVRRKKNVPVLMFKTDDERTYEEIIRTVPVDDLV